MSANRDRSQKITFVYSNLYQLYKKGSDPSQGAQQPAAPSVDAPVEGVNPGLTVSLEELKQGVSEEQVRARRTGAVIKVADRQKAEVSPYQPMTLIVRKPEVLAAKPAVVQADEQVHALESLKENLQTLNDLHARLRFMLKELEELVKE